MNKIARSELCAEFFGSMFLVIAAISPMILFVSVLESSVSVAVLANAVAVAFVLCALIEMFGSISGAHFNPIVTMVMVLEKKVSTTKATLFVLFQIIGGLAGTALTHLMFKNEVGGVYTISDKVRSDYIYTAEIIGSFILVLAILMLVNNNSNKISIIIGLLVGGQIMATSSTMFANPQVTIARMFTDSAAGIRPIDGLVFIAMQIIGALLAYAVYRLMFSKIESGGNSK
jgi:glycerol uptake facilitator-like aquaporin